MEPLEQPQSQSTLTDPPSPVSIPTSDLPVWWVELERCREFLEPSLKRTGKLTWESVREAVRVGKLWLWPMAESAMLIEFIQHPALRTCSIQYAGGRLDELMQAEEDFVAWAREMQADRIELTGRKGWERVLKKHLTDWNGFEIKIYKDL